jgi:hypothetical protein
MHVKHPTIMFMKSAAAAVAAGAAQQGPVALCSISTAEH